MTELVKPGARGAYGHSNIPGGNYVDTKLSTVTQEEIDKLTEYLFTASGFKSVDNPNFGLSVTTEQTNRVDNESIAPIVTKMFNALWITQKGWWTVLATVEKRGINERHQMEIWPSWVLEPTPEDAPPRHITHSTYQWLSKMDRYRLGAKFRVEELQRDRDTQVFYKSMQSLVGATWTTAKLSVTIALYNGKQYWRDFSLKQGKAYYDIEQASRGERELFGILNKNDRALYRLNTYASRLAESQGKKFTNVVLPSGTLDLVANNTFETDVSQRGESQAIKTLSLGGKGLENVISGVSVYEDFVWNVENLEKDGIEQFIRRVWVGQYFSVLGSDLPFGSVDEYDTEKLLSTQIPSAEGNKWVTLGPREFVDWDQRFNEDDGELTSHHDRLLEYLPQYLQESGLEVVDNILDPYMWKTDAPAEDLNSRSANGAGFKTIELWGDADIRFAPTKKFVDQGRQFKKNLIRDASVTPNDIQNMNELHRISKMLNTPMDVLDESIQGYAFAIAANPENAGSLFLNGGAFGAPLPPYVEQRGNMNVMYVYDTDMVTKLYVVVARDNAPADANDVVPEDTPAVYALTTLNRDGTIPDNNTPYADGTKVFAFVAAPSRPYMYGAITGLRTLASLNGSINNRGWTKLGDQQEDILGKVAVGIDALDRCMGKFYECYPRNPMFESKFIPAFMKTGDDEMDKMNLAIQSLWDKIYYPVMFRIPSGPNARSRYVGVSYSGDGRAEAGFSDDELRRILSNMGFQFGAGNPAAPGTVGILSVHDANLGVYVTILKNVLNSGLVSAEIKESLKKDNGVSLFTSYRDPNRHLGHSLQKDLKQLHGGIPKDARIPDFAWFFKYNIVDEQNAEARAKALNGVLGLVLANVQIKELTQSYIDTLKTASPPRTGTKGKRKGFELEDEANSAIGNIKPPKGIDFDTGETQWINSRLTLDESVWKNLHNRLIKDNNLTNIIRFHRMVIRPSNRKDQTKAVAGALIRSQEASTRRASYMPDPSAAAGTIGNQIRLFQYAGPHKGRGLGIFSNLDLVNYGGSDYNENKRRAGAPGDLYAGVPRRLENIASQYALSEYADDEHGRRIPNTMYNNPLESPFYSTVKFTDMRGINVRDATTVVQKKWLVVRMNEIEEEVGSDIVVRMAAQLACLTRVNKFSVITWIDKKLPLIFDNWIIAMPFMRFQMGDGCWFIPGAETARIGYNYENIHLQLDTVHQTWYLDVSIWLGTTVYDPSNYIIIPSLVFRGYDGGYNAIPFTNPENFNVDDIADSKSSIFIWSCGGNLKSKDIPEPLTLTSHYNEAWLKYNLVDRNSFFHSKRPLLPCGIFYTTVWGYREINRNSIYDTATYAKERNSNYRNEVMYSGSQKLYSPVTKDWTLLKEGQGHVASILPPFMSVIHGDSLASNGPAIKSH